MNLEINEKIKQIKQSFRLMMDGATAASMRQKGLDYKLNWGATLPRLREKADEIGYDYDLAIALWKEDIRECKILATMIMPPEKMLPEIVDIWMEQTKTIEVAEQAAFNLYQHLTYIADKAYMWISSPDDLYQICGYHVLSRLFIQGKEPNEQGINEFLDQAFAAIHSTNISLQKAVMQSVIHFARLGIVYERIAKSCFMRAGMDFI
jgi:hypothetical protein